MKIYIAGKITGDENYREKFNQAQRKYENHGHVVINPSVLPAGLSPADYMRICFAMIDTAEIVAFLPDYRESPGAMLELQYCRYTGKQRILPV
jgi:hypothetical protein